MSRKKILVFFSILFALVFSDLYTKYLAEKKLVISQEAYAKEIITEGTAALDRYRTLIHGQQIYYAKEIPLVKDRFSLFYTRNYNIGFSILSFLNQYLTPDQITLFIKILQSSILVFILIYFFFNKMKLLLPFSFIIAGGIGNSLDRLYRDYVIDFFKVSIPELPWALFNPWPIFNLADVWVSIGGSLLFLAIFFSKKPKKKLRDYQPYRKL